MVFGHERGKGILGMFLWRSIPLLMDLPCMMGIYVPYISSALLMSYMVIGQFLVLFSTASFSVCVDNHPTICWNNIASSATLI